jgi:hypothetical protein
MVCGGVMTDAAHNHAMSMRACMIESKITCVEVDYDIPPTNTGYGHSFTLTPITLSRLVGGVKHPAFIRIDTVKCTTPGTTLACHELYTRVSPTEIKLTPVFVKMLDIYHRYGGLSHPDIDAARGNPKSELMQHMFRRVVKSAKKMHGDNHTRYPPGISNQTIKNYEETGHVAIDFREAAATCLHHVRDELDAFKGYTFTVTNVGPEPINTFKLTFIRDIL